MKQLKLSNGNFALVDDEDFESVNQFRWSEKPSLKTSYACSGIKQSDGKFKNISLHRFILKINNPKIYVDHKDHNGLNCQKNNIRTATPSQNQMNSIGRGKSKYLGVHIRIQKTKYFSKKLGQRIYTCKMFVSQIRTGGKQICLGQFKTEEEAALCYNVAAKKYHREFANLNIL